MPGKRKSGKPKVAVFKFASCDGCQLSLLDAEDELLDVAGAIDIAFFPEASRRMLRGPYDIGIVEGSITTPHDVEHIRESELGFAGSELIEIADSPTPKA